VELSNLFAALPVVGILLTAETGGFLVGLLVVFGLLVVVLLLVVVVRLVVLLVVLLVGRLVVVEVVADCDPLSAALLEAQRPGYVVEQVVAWGQAEQLAPCLYICPLMKLPLGA